MDEEYERINEMTRKKKRDDRKHEGRKKEPSPDTNESAKPRDETHERQINLITAHTHAHRDTHAYSGTRKTVRTVTN